MLEVEVTFELQLTGNGYVVVVDGRVTGRRLRGDPVAAVRDLQPDVPAAGLGRDRLWLAQVEGDVAGPGTRGGLGPVQLGGGHVPGRRGDDDLAGDPGHRDVARAGVGGNRAFDIEQLDVA